jgi:hypothetical protein
VTVQTTPNSSSCARPPYADSSGRGSVAQRSRAPGSRCCGHHSTTFAGAGPAPAAGTTGSARRESPGGGVEEADPGSGSAYSWCGPLRRWPSGTWRPGRPTLGRAG